MTMGDESLFAAMAMPVVMSPILEKVSADRVSIWIQIYFR